MSSISLNSRNVSKYLWKSLKPVPLRLNLIYLANIIVRFYSASESRDEILFRGEGCDIQVIRKIDTRFSVKGVCLLWCMFVAQRNRGIIVIL
jgi:hypothetical protein